MKVIQPKVIIPKGELNQQKLINLERYGRVCYKSDSSFTVESANKFLAGILKRGHESVIEHEKVTVIFVVDRGVSHEIVRHRIASYSQESTRYCNYSGDKFGNEITVIKPFFFDDIDKFEDWEQAVEIAEHLYFSLIALGADAQEARSVLPNSLKTEIVVTMNFREWRHFFKLRCSPAAHPQMRQVAIPLLLMFNYHFPVLFDDIKFDHKFEQKYLAEVVTE